MIGINIGRFLRNEKVFESEQSFFFLLHTLANIQKYLMIYGGEFYCVYFHSKQYI